MASVIPEIFSRQEAERRRHEILVQVGDAHRFRERGEAYELNADELVLYDELLTLDYLLFGRKHDRGN